MVPGEQGYELVGQIRSSHSGDFGMVIDRRHLDDVGADEAQAIESAQHCKQFPTGHAPCLRCSCARRMRWVEHIDVDRNVKWGIAGGSTQVLNNVVDGAAQEVHAAHNGETEVGVGGEVVRGVERTSDAHVGAASADEQAFLSCPTEGRSVRERRVEVGVPGVEVRVEMDEGNRAMHPIQSLQQLVGDRVVTS